MKNNKKIMDLIQSNELPSDNDVVVPVFECNGNPIRSISMLQIYEGIKNHIKQNAVVFLTQHSDGTISIKVVPNGKQ